MQNIHVHLQFDKWIFELLFSHYMLLLADDARYFQELLKNIDNPRIRNAAKEVYVARERLEIGNMLGKGHCT